MMFLFLGLLDANSHQVLPFGAMTAIETLISSNPPRMGKN